MITVELNTPESLVLTYKGVPLKKVEQFNYLGLVFMGLPGMATMEDARMVKAKQA